MTEPKTDFKRYENEVEALVKRNEPKHAAVFYGSSTFTLWGHEKLASDLSPIKAVNRGFGGSTAHEALYYYERLVQPLEPDTIICYEGDNDLASGYTPKEVIELLSVLFDKIRTDFPGIRFYILTVKFTKSRKMLWDSIDELNKMLEEYAEKHADTGIINMKDVTHDEKGKAREDIYLQDELHFNEKGYLLLKSKIKEVLLK